MDKRQANERRDEYMNHQHSIKEVNMKKANRTIITAGVIALIAASWGLFPASGQAMSLSDLDNTWGKPAVAVKAENGAEKRFYKYDNTMDLGYRVFQIQSGEVIDLGINGSAPKIEAARAMGLPVNSMSREYWANHPTRVEDLMGQPVSTRQLPDGAVEMFYKITGAPDIGHRYFLVKDGKIVASGTTAAALSDPKAVVKNAPKTIDRSKDYYQNHGTAVETVEVTWGKPVQVKKFDNGTEERLYKYMSTQDMGYRFFLFKDGKVVASGTQG
jgi:hypothetical protein